MTSRLFPSLCSITRLASVVVVVGLSARANGQAFQCSNATSVSPIVRAEGFAEQVGDIVLDCTGGVPTPPNQMVPTVNITVNLDVNQTSKVTAVIGQVEFLESLLIVDEPNSAFHLRPILNCGRVEAPDFTQAGPGVCSIFGGGSLGAANTYDGTVGHPNVFQGRSLQLVTGQLNQVVFTGIPIDPPGTVCPNPVNGQCHRIIRITGIRGDATAKGVVVPNVTQTINSTLVINPFSGLPVDNISHAVATVAMSMVAPAVGAGSVVVREGFNNAFKPRGLTQVLANGFAKPVYSYSGTPNPIPGINHNENVPGAVYDTESGFTNSLDSAHGDNPFNPLTGGAGAGVAFSNVGGINTGIANAGVADSGTRIAFQFDIPAGASVQVPQVVQLANVVSGFVGTGVMMLTNADQSGAGPFSPAATGILSGANDIAVYEVLFANPNALEQAELPYTLLNAPPHSTLTVSVSYAPFFSPTDDVRRASATLPVPRLMPLSAPQTVCPPGCVLLSPSVGFNSGPLGVTLTGDLVLSNAQVKLSQAGFPDILGLNTFNSDPSTLTATFDLTGAAPGYRNVVVTPQSGTPFTLSQKFQIQASQTSDTTAPLLTSFFFSPTSVDVSASQQTFTVNATIIDDLSGFSYAYVEFISPNNQYVYSYFNRTQGTPVGGAYQTTVTVPRFVQPGVWKAHVGLGDLAGNNRSLSPSDLLSHSFPTDLTVIDSTPDVQAPTLLGASLSPTSIDVSSGDINITVSLRISDNLSGVCFPDSGCFDNSVYVSLVAPTTTTSSSPAHQYIYGSDFHLVSGTPLNGTWQAVKRMPRYSPSGNWQMESIGLGDLVRNTGYLNTAQLQAAGINPILSVSSSPSDTAPPVLGGLNFSPPLFNTSAGSQLVNITLSASDNLSGLDFSQFGIGLRSPSGGQFVNGYVVGNAGGTPLAGTWQVSAFWPRYSEEGTWQVFYVELADAVGNAVVYTPPMLEAMGIPDTIVVTKPSLNTDGKVGDGTITDNSFGTRASLTFPPNLAPPNTEVSIDVFPEPLPVPTPHGFTTPGTYFVNVGFSPALPMPLASPGITVVLPLLTPMTPNTILKLYHIDPVQGVLAPTTNALGQTPAEGKVNQDGVSATFLNIVTLSTVVAYLPNGSVLGDIDNNGLVNCSDVSLLRASFGKRTGQSGFNLNADLNNDGVVDVRDLLVVTRQLPAGTTCP